MAGRRSTATKADAAPETEFEVADQYKDHAEFMIGTNFIPIVNGKVKCNAETKEFLTKRGFLK